jgi:hypothetical protein
MATQDLLLFVTQPNRGENMTKENKDEGTLKTRAFTYEVKMIVQILAEDEKEARSRLDNQGGYVTSREVALKDTIPLFNGKTEE